MIIIRFVLFIAMVILLFVAGIAGYAFLLMKKRPPLKFYKERSMQPDYIFLSQIPKRHIALLLALEDKDFYTHSGFLFYGIWDALKKNIKAKQIVTGGSTITQQLAKNLYFRFYRNYSRKIAELVIVMVLERKLGKDKILELYLNIIYFGNGIYGITDASHFYFTKPVSYLSTNEMYILASIIPAPTKGNPILYPQELEQRRNYTLPIIMGRNPTLISQEEAKHIMSYSSDHLDPDLREADDYIKNYPQTIPMVNERFGPPDFKGVWHHSKAYSNSSMVSYTRLSPNHSGPRTHSIDRITPHCSVHQYCAESMGDIFADPDGRVSTNYGIDKDGRVGLYVEERNRSWCSSSRENDHRAVTIECASDGTEPFAFHEIVYQTLIRLCVDICRRNGKEKLLWLGDRDMTLEYSPSADEMILTVHRWFTDKSCPGTWMYSRMGDLADQVTAELNR